MIDSHCHLDFEVFDDSRSEIFENCKKDGIHRIVIPGVDTAQWPKVKNIKSKSQYIQIHQAIGVHPWWVAKEPLTPRELKLLIREFCFKNPVSAVGECGLDGSIETSLDYQLDYFNAQVEIAIELNLPLIVHAYKAHNEVLKALIEYKPRAAGVIHGFSGSIQLAEQYWKLGFYLGVGGTITYPRANKTRAAIKAMPLESLLLETDSPDMPLNGYQGEINKPYHVKEVARCLAELKEISVVEVERQTDANVCALFSL